MEMSITSRVFAEADFILKSNGTVRSVAKCFGVSKSTVHNDLSKKLKRLNNSLYEKVNILLKFNLAERHIRGGEATKKKYKELEKK
ncbi:MAG: sporulation transcriptional regulator SpoIIID [Christensenellales bacterium]